MTSGWWWALPLVPALAAAAALAEPVPGAAGRQGTAARRGTAGRGANVAVTASAVTAVGTLLLLLSEHLTDPATVRLTTAAIGPHGTVVLGTRVDGLTAVVAPAVGVTAFLVQLHRSAVGQPARRGRDAGLVCLLESAALLVVLSAGLVQLAVGWTALALAALRMSGRRSGRTGGWPGAAVVTAAAAALALPAAAALAIRGAGTDGIGAVLGWGGCRNGAGCPGRGEPAVAALVVVAALALAVGTAWPVRRGEGISRLSVAAAPATAVVGGVYLVARLYPVLTGSPVALDTLGVAAGAAMVAGAAAALLARDLATLVAAATASQAGAVLAGMAVGGYTAGLYHLVVAVAALTLLWVAGDGAAGGGLAPPAGPLAGIGPVRFAGFCSGAAALAGLPPWSGSFSRVALLGAAAAAARTASPVVPVARPVAALVLVAGVATALLTAGFAARAVLRLAAGVGGPGRAGGRPAGWRVVAPVVFLGLAVAVLGVEASAPEMFSWVPPPLPGTGAPHLEPWGYVGVGLAVFVVAAATAASGWRGLRRVRAAA